MLTSPDVDPVEPAGTELLRPYFGMRRFEWEEDDVDRLPPRLRRLDPRARRRTASRSRRWSSCATPGTDSGRYDLFTAEWAERWPAEEMWKARKIGVSAPPAPPLLLASTSPQRRAILEQLGLPFDVVAPGYEEHDPPDADPVELVRAHAHGKARSVAGEAGDRPVLGVDTTVVCGGRVYGKARGRRRGGGDAGGARRRHARGRLRASACSRPGGRSCTPRRRA